MRRHRDAPSPRNGTAGNSRVALFTSRSTAAGANSTEIWFGRWRAVTPSKRILSIATPPPLLAWAGLLALTASAFIRMDTLNAVPMFSPDPASCRHREVFQEAPHRSPIATAQPPRRVEPTPVLVVRSRRIPAGRRVAQVV